MCFHCGGTCPIERTICEDCMMDGHQVNHLPCPRCQQIVSAFKAELGEEYREMIKWMRFVLEEDARI